jgi:propionyl-CoA carboxylase beta chain
MNIVPENANKPYDMHDVIKGIIDEDSFFEIHKNYAENIIVGFARLAGRSIGIVANNPMYLAGCLDVKSSIKAARFTRFCDCFNIPLLVFRGCAWFSSRTPRMEWNYCTWCQIVVCSKRSNSSKSNCNYQKSLWWCL